MPRMMEPSDWDDIAEVAPMLAYDLYMVTERLDDEARENGIVPSTGVQPYDLQGRNDSNTEGTNS